MWSPGPSFCMVLSDDYQCPPKPWLVLALLWGVRYAHSTPFTMSSFLSGLFIESPESDQRYMPPLLLYRGRLRKALCTSLHHHLFMNSASLSDSGGAERSRMVGWTYVWPWLCPLLAGNSNLFWPLHSCHHLRSPYYGWVRHVAISQTLYYLILIRKLWGRNSF